jgi:hypothetical protein
MPFDPKLIHPDEPPLTPAGELNLPADLAALAEQLGDDAQHLAGCYPADAALRAEGVSPLRKSSSSQPRRTLAAIVLASGVTLASVALVGLAIAFGLMQDEAGQPTRHSLVQTPTSPPGTASPAAEPVVAPRVVSPGPAPTTLSLGELSGPELEALLDLWPSKDQKSAASISF